MAARVRSPAYPAITIDEAVDRARVLYKIEGKHPALVKTAVSHWGYKPKSSGGTKTVAALKAYGLLVDEGSGPDRKVWLSNDGLTIVRDEREVSPDRNHLIGRLALKPKILLEMWNTYGTELPSEDTVRHFLTAEREYNPSAVSDIIRVYLAAAKRHQEAFLDEFEDLSEQEDDASPDPDGSGHAKGIKMRQDTFTLDEGTVTIEWPERLSKASFDDLRDWLTIMGRKIERAAARDDERAAEEGN
ncbi:MAG TPA: hypothetical protein VM616_07055 [Gammaproteobacteria bacterium]|nr:hypothetical protein [Gammaproteobacteria bacterium]